jgi:signal transduction histidine kinase
VTVSTADGRLCLVVADDGVGPPAPDAPRGNGLANMAQRAERLGGSCVIAARDGGGTELTWDVPLS